MRDDDALPVSTSTSSLDVSSSFSSGVNRKESSSDSSAFSVRGSTKFVVLTAILFLALWSMIAGTLTLRWSAMDLRNRFTDDTSPAAEDLDVLDLEEREKLLRHMWDACVHGRHMTLESFWQEAFVAAFEDSTSDVMRLGRRLLQKLLKCPLGTLVSIHHLYILQFHWIQGVSSDTITKKHDLSRK